MYWKATGRPVLHYFENCQALLNTDANIYPKYKRKRNQRVCNLCIRRVDVAQQSLKEWSESHARTPSAQTDE